MKGGHIEILKAELVRRRHCHVARCCRTWGVGVDPVSDSVAGLESCAIHLCKVERKEQQTGDF